MAEKPREIDWAGAEVKHGSVVLPLSGEPSKAWSDRFGGVLALLAQNTGAWGEVRLTKKAIAVADLAPGAEDDLRHFLESIVVQVNSELAVKPDQVGANASQTADPRAAGDEQMAERLRSFAARQQ
jgi:hypothetical protein